MCTCDMNMISDKNVSGYIIVVAGLLFDDDDDAFNW